MKKGIISILLFCCFTIVAWSQSDSVSEDRTIGKFSGIDVCCGIKVYVKEGTSSTLKVESNQKDFIQYIKTEVKNDVLHIYIQKNNKKEVCRKCNVKVYLSAKDLKK